MISWSQGAKLLFGPPAQIFVYNLTWFILKTYKFGDSKRDPRLRGPGCNAPDPPPSCTALERGEWLVSRFSHFNSEMNTLVPSGWAGGPLSLSRRGVQEKYPWPCRESKPGHPAHSQSRYWLSWMKMQISSPRMSLLRMLLQYMNFITALTDLKCDSLQWFFRDWNLRVKLIKYTFVLSRRPLSPTSFVICHPPILCYVGPNLRSRESVVKKYETTFLKLFDNDKLCYDYAGHSSSAKRSERNLEGGEGGGVRGSPPTPWILGRKKTTCLQNLPLSMPAFCIEIRLEHVQDI
jgi:hypothetical protein